MVRPLAALLVVVALIGLAPAAPVPKHMMPKGPQFNYPTALGTKWVYVIEGGGEHTRVITRVEEKNGAKFVTIDWSAPAGRKPDQSVHVVTKDGVYIHAESGQAYDPPLLYFKLPYRAGDSWKSTFARPGLKVSTQTTAGPVEKIKVPAGEFSAVRVDVEMSFNGQGKQTRARWLANGIGMVKAEKSCVLKSFTLGKD
ncbi:hypothetical protein J8F10_13450 [Gemmata sp. G18]|uniref:DUF3108 domain-containing protein n=1 Tax=Gemmata palustris TaxID=2822762 RepID=A0ABS5BRD6_9BACT|nr:hypothetical protein [Gemmata palustris]MBP3956290.1 hypothetical protein [Gemmata palustris]